MKEPAYVANVVKQYRKAFGEGADQVGRKLCRRRLTRTYTEYMFGEDQGSITNIQNLIILVTRDQRNVESSFKEHV